MNADADIVDGGCNGEVLSDGVLGKKGDGGDAEEVMSEGDKSPTTRVTRTVLAHSCPLFQIFCPRDCRLSA